MNDWQSRLRDADPEQHAVMPASEVQRMRGVVIAAARDAGVRRSLTWPRAFVVTATLLVLVCASVLAGLQRATRQMDDASAGSPVPIAEGEEETGVARQQLQFQTPGGTRIIWVFDSQFEVKGTVP